MASRDPVADATSDAPDLGVGVLGPGSVVVSSGSARGVDRAVHRTLERFRVRARATTGIVSPKLTSACTRAVIFVTDDVDEAVRGCAALREWAHESLVPTVVVFAGDDDNGARTLWERALVVVRRWELDTVLGPLVAALDAARDGLPTARDAELAWQGRIALRQDRWAMCGRGLSAFAAANTLFVGGLAHDHVAAEALKNGLAIPRAHSINFAALQVWDSPHCARPLSERTH